MTTRYTNAEWTSIIASTTSALTTFASPVSSPPTSPPSITSTVPTTTTTSTHTSPRALARAIDHTLLKPSAKPHDIDNLCAEARTHGFASVVVRPQWAQRCKRNLKGSRVGLGVEVVGELGDGVGLLSTARAASTSGATSLTLSLPPHLLQSSSYESLYQTLSTLRSALPRSSTSLSLSLSSTFSPPRLIALCVLAHNANFSTIELCANVNHSPDPAAGSALVQPVRVEDVSLARKCVDVLAASDGSARMTVKTSGGVSTVEDAEAFLAAGAERLGCSTGVWVLREAGEVCEVERGVGSEKGSREGSREGSGRSRGESGSGRSGSGGSGSLGRKGSPAGSEMGSVYQARPGLATRLWTDF